MSVAGSCNELLQTFLAQMRPQFRVTWDNETCLLTTPYLFPDNTEIAVGLRQCENGQVELSDLGEAFDYVFVNGVSESVTAQRLPKIRQRFHVKTDDNELTKVASLDELSSATYEVVGAIQDMAYLVYQRSHRPAKSFDNQVERYLIDQKWSFQRNATVQGKSAPHTFNFRVPMDHARQLFLFTLSTNSEQNAYRRAEQFAYETMDSVSGGALQVEDVAVIIDDRSVSERDVISSRVLTTLINYLGDVVLWSDRTSLDKKIAA